MLRFKISKHLTFDSPPSNTSLASLPLPCCPFSMRTQGGGYRVDSFDLLFVSREEARAWRGVNNSIANERKSKRDSLGWAMSVQLSITRRIVLRGFPVPLTMSQDLSSRIEWGQKNVLYLGVRKGSLMEYGL